MSSIPLPPLPPQPKIIVAGYGAMGHQTARCIQQAPSLTLMGVISWEHILPGKEGAENPAEESQQFTQWLKHQKTALHCTSGLNQWARQLADLQPDLLILATWGEILLPDTLAALPFPIINIHPSLLPAYRGANPYCAALLNNETTTGLTAHMVTEAVDEGPILGQVSVPIFPDDTGGQLKQRSALAIENWLPALLGEWCHGTLTATPQAPPPAEAHRQHAPNLKLWHGQLNPYLNTAQQLQRQLRAYHPWLPCFTHVVSRAQCLPGQEKTLLVFLPQATIDPTPAGGPLGELQHISASQIRMRCADHRWLHLTLTSAYWGEIPLHPRLFNAMLPRIIGTNNTSYLSSPQ